MPRPDAGPDGPRILVADHEPVYAAGVLAVLSAAGLTAGFAELAEPSGLGLTPTDILVVDDQFGERTIVELVGRVGALVVVVRTPTPRALRLVRTGVAGLVERRAPISDLVAAVIAARAGRTWLSAGLATMVRTGEPPVGLREVVLTTRQAQVLAVLATGASNAAIGEALDISANTVRNHVQGLFAALGASNRTDALLIAVREGLVELPG